VKHGIKVSMGMHVSCERVITTSQANNQISFCVKTVSFCWHFDNLYGMFWINHGFIKYCG